MSSKALYLSKVVPRLVHRQSIAPGCHTSSSSSSSLCNIEIWTTTCIVMNFGGNSKAAAAGTAAAAAGGGGDGVGTTDIQKQTNDNNNNNNKNKMTNQNTVLINPANPQLSGVSKFPYFPKGGPVPSTPQHQGHYQYAHHIMGHVSQWGGMEVGHGMLFPVSVVDGLVHMYGGWQLKAALKWHQAATTTATTGDACPVGSAVRTTAGADLLGQAYNAVIHTAPPFYHYPPTDATITTTAAVIKPQELLFQCYTSALNQIQPTTDRYVATPLLGAGCRGFPLDEAMDIAIEATTTWCLQRDNNNKNKDKDKGDKRNRDKDKKEAESSSSSITIAFALLEESWAKDMTQRLVEWSDKHHQEQ